MTFKNRLLEKYNLNEDKLRLTPLRRYINFIGLDWSKMSTQQIDKIARMQAYKQFKGLRKIKKIINKNAEASDNVQESIPSSVAKKKIIVDLINRGYSQHYKLSKSLSGSPRHRGFKAPAKSSLRFSKDIYGHGTKHKSLRLPKKRSDVKGKVIGSMIDDIEVNAQATIIEAKMNQVEKLLTKSKQMKEKEQNNSNTTPQDFEIQKTMTGDSANTNVIEINPTIAASSRLNNIS
nr:MAG: hypothetical protein [Caudoviricetes sp.]